MNETIMNGLRSTWLKENSKPEKPVELTPYQQELLHWKSEETEARLLIQSVTLQKVFMRTQFGLNEDNYDFSDINFRIIALEDRLHYCTKKLDGLRFPR